MGCSPCGSTQSALHTITMALYSTSVLATLCIPHCHLLRATAAHAVCCQCRCNKQQQVKCCTVHLCCWSSTCFMVVHVLHSSAGAPIPRFQAPGIMPEGLYLAYGGELVCALFAVHLTMMPIEGSVVPKQRAWSAPCAAAAACSQPHAQRCSHTDACATYLHILHFDVCE